jgi:uncharacterized protein (TIGR03382 family)
MLLLLVHLASADELPQMVNADGNAIHWPQMPISFKVDPSNEAGLDAERLVVAVAQGAAAWNDIPESSVALQFMGTAKNLPMAHDEVNGVSFLAEWPLDPEMLAVTNVWSTGDGTAVGFDMQVNTSDHGWSLDGARDAADVQNTMAHEFGHVLGIGHLEKNPDATMYPSAVHGETLKRDLSEDDRWVAMNLYPSVDGGAGPAGSRFGLCATSGGASGALPAALALLALVARRRASRSEVA